VLATGPATATIEVEDIDDGPPGGARAEDLGASTINAKKRRRWAPWRVLAVGPAAATTEVEDIDGGPTRGAGAEDPGAPTINAKKHR
jgi:hypothetical protein